MAAIKIQKTELRFDSKKQKLALKRIAVKNKRSLNAEINKAIDFYTTSYYWETIPKEQNTSTKEPIRDSQ